MDDLLNYIREGLKKPGKSLVGLSRALGKDDSVGSKILGEKRAVKSGEISKIRAYFDGPQKTAPKPQGERASVDNSQRMVASPNTMSVESAPGTASLQDQPRDLPILGSVRAGADGFFLDQGEVQGMARRPPILIGIKNAFAVYVRDESMMPSLKPGHIAWVHPYKPPIIGENALIEMRDGQAFVKEYRRQTEKYLVCFQYRPEQEVRYDRAKIKSIMLVVGSCIEE